MLNVMPNSAATLEFNVLDQKTPKGKWLKTLPNQSKGTSNPKLGVEAPFHFLAPNLLEEKTTANSLQHFSRQISV